MSDMQLAVSDSVLLPVMNVETALSAYEEFRKFVQGILKPGIDFGVIPGTSKPTLLKPGAEKLTRFFGLAARFEITKETELWDAEEPLFYYRYRCALHRISDGALVGEGEGSCNSREKKYRYRNADRVCPSCGQPTIIKGKDEYGGGWLCYAKKGGCGSKWADGAKAIEDQQVGQIVNTDIADQINTFQKMAQKRALIAAVLVACNASDYFTQDLEDLDYGNPAPFKPQQHSNTDFYDAPPMIDGDNFVDTHSAKFAQQLERVDTKAAQAASATLYGNAPRDPQTLRDDIASAINRNQAKAKHNEPYPKGSQGILVNKLNKMLGDDNARHAVLEYLVGNPSTKNLTNAEGWSLMDWVQNNSDASDEAQAVLAALEAGS